MMKLIVSSGNGVKMLTLSHFNEFSTKDAESLGILLWPHLLISLNHRLPRRLRQFMRGKKVTFPYDMVRRGILTSTHIFLFGGYLQCLQPDLICISGTHCF